ncbi:MAG: ABC transporter substrate-binding protein, partial [Pseudomonadota bacterium]
MLQRSVQWLLCLIVLILAMPCFAQGPEELVRDTTAELFTAVDQDRARFEQHPDQLVDVTYDILVPLIDVVYSGRLVLGRSGRSLSPEQIQRFADQMSDLLINRYADTLL